MDDDAVMARATRIALANPENDLFAVAVRKYWMQHMPEETLQRLLPTVYQNDVRGGAFFSQDTVRKYNLAFKLPHEVAKEQEKSRCHHHTGIVVVIPRTAPAAANMSNQ